MYNRLNLNKLKRIANNAKYNKPFFETFVEAPFCHRISQFLPTPTPKLTPSACFRKLFQKHVKTEKCVWTAPACTDCI